MFVLTKLIYCSCRLTDQEYMELVFENGQFLAKSQRSNAFSLQNQRTKSIVDLYEEEYNEDFKQVCSRTSCCWIWNKHADESTYFDSDFERLFIKEHGGWLWEPKGDRVYTSWWAICGGCWKVGRIQLWLHRFYCRQWMVDVSKQCKMIDSWFGFVSVC